MKNNQVILAERIELEETQIREGNLDRLEEFLNNANGQALTIERHGTRYIESLDWTYSCDETLLILKDEDEEKCGTEEIDLDDILDVGTQLFQDDVLVIDFCNGDTMSISIDW